MLLSSSSHEAPVSGAVKVAGDVKGGIVEPPSRRVLTFAAEHLTTSLLLVVLGVGSCGGVVVVYSSR